MAKQHECSKCGETNPEKFYGHKKSICGKCHNAEVIKKGQENKRFAIEYLGGKCIYCGYDEFDCSLDLHHINPEEKDTNFATKRGWSRERLIKELDKCVLLCRNCHQAFHGGHISLDNIIKNK